MHTRKTHEFQTETEAKEFVIKQQSFYDPSMDQYVSGPTFIDEDVVFRHNPDLSTHRKYWLVTVETYR